MREAVHCPFCEILLVALDEVDLFILLRRHMDAKHDTLCVSDDEVHQIIAYLASLII